MSFFAELKRRNVFRVGLAYLIAAWVIAQVADLVLTSIKAPDWVMQALLLLFGLGFVVALIISWAYELTPEGIKKDKDVVRDESVTSITAKKLDYITLAGVCLVIALIVYQQMNPAHLNQDPLQNSVNADNADNAKEDITTNKVSDNSIAVLPFVDLSPEKDQSHFSDGIAEEILNVLVRIEELTVASRTSAFGFKGQEALGIPVIAERLNVRHILEGSVRKSGDKVRITAQLIDAQTDAHLWSNTFDRQLTTENIFAVQDEIAGAIVKQLGLMIGDQSIAQPHVKVTTENLDAYELYLRARALYYKRSRQNLPQTVELFEQAVAIDPDFAEAWAGLSASYVVMPGWFLGTPEEYHPKARAAADRASKLNDNLALPYSVRGTIAGNEGDMIGAFEQRNMALIRDPTNIETIYGQAVDMLHLGYLDQAVDGFKHCLTLDSSYEICRPYLSFALLFKGKIDEANDLFVAGVLSNNRSYKSVFRNYFGAINDKRSLSLLLAADYEELWVRALFYQLQTDVSFGLDEVNAELKLHANTDGEPFKPWSLEQIASQTFEAEFSWSPYYIALRKPEMIDEYLSLRKESMLENGFVAYWRKYGFPPQCRALADDDFECDLPVAANR